jgi:hypothetical protein
MDRGVRRYATGRFTSTAAHVADVGSFTSTASYAPGAACWKAFDTPDLAPLLTKVVDRAGWRAGSNVLFMLAEDASSANDGGSAVARATAGATPTLTYSFGETLHAETLGVEAISCGSTSAPNAAGNRCVCDDGYRCVYS